jgi:hypothetical protein
MRLFCVLLLLTMATPGCSRFTKTGRMDRAYYKQLKEAKSARAKQNHKTKKNPSMIPSPDAPPLLQPQPNVQPTSVQPAPESPEQ